MEAKEASLVDKSPLQNNPQDHGKSLFGCAHYLRRCKIIAPCCLDQNQKQFMCHRCHDEDMDEFAPKEIVGHSIVRDDVVKVVCLFCNTEQEVAQTRVGCGVKMGEYFCEICKIYDDDISKQHFHCDGCGICRVGGRSNYFHCQKCGSCYHNGLLNNHVCVENCMKSDCPFCCEDLFSSTSLVTVLRCGHVMYNKCYKSLIKANTFRCTLCSKSICNMERTWEETYKKSVTAAASGHLSYKVDIICKDCLSHGPSIYQKFGARCTVCGSYNTKLK